MNLTIDFGSCIKIICCPVCVFIPEIEIYLDKSGKNPSLNTLHKFIILLCVYVWRITVPKSSVYFYEFLFTQSPSFALISRSGV